MNQFRLPIGAVFAALVTAVLFILMPALIESADKSLDESESFKLPDITMPAREIETNIAEAKPEKPPEPEEPPPPMETPQMDNIDPSVEAVDMTPAADTVQVEASGGGLAASDGEYLPIVKVAPIYPRRAQSRGVTGHCTVKYTVTKTGQTRDIEPVDCDPPGYFERASQKAAAKFKYKPRVVDGEPIEVPNIHNRFTFELDK